MNKSRILIIALLISNVWFVYLYLTKAEDNRESAGAKREWGILQSLEYDHRQQPIDKIEFRDIDGYHIVCVRSEAGKRTWIMLNPKYPPFYKQMPQVQFSLSSDQFNQIEGLDGHQALTSTVEICLLSHVIKN